MDTTNSISLMETLNKLWQELGDIPVDDDGCIEQNFQRFPAGTDREDIWLWFENQHPDFSAGKRIG